MGGWPRSSRMGSGGHHGGWKRCGDGCYGGRLYAVGKLQAAVDLAARMGFSDLVRELHVESEVFLRAWLTFFQEEGARMSWFASDGECFNSLKVDLWCLDFHPNGSFFKRTYSLKAFAQSDGNSQWEPFTGPWQISEEAAVSKGAWEVVTRREDDPNIVGGNKIVLSGITNCRH